MYTTKKKKNKEKQQNTLKRNRNSQATKQAVPKMEAALPL